MSKTIMTIILTVIGVLFAIQNFDHVPLYLFWGKAINIRLIFIIIIAGIVGYMIRHFVGIAREDALKRRFQALRMNSAKNGKKAQPDYFDEEEY